MKFKLDENLSPSLATLFSGITSDVYSVTHQSLNGAPDERVIDACTREGRTPVSMDLDFSNISCLSAVTILRHCRIAAPESGACFCGGGRASDGDYVTMLASYLETESDRKTRAFCDIVNEMVEAGGDQRNAIATCLLEHASQIGCGKLLKPYLSVTAKQELRCKMPRATPLR